MDMKYFWMGILAVLTFITVATAASVSNKWQNGYQTRDISYPSAPVSRQQWLNFMRRSHQWKNGIFLRYAKKEDEGRQRTCGKKLTIRVARVCFGCSPSGLRPVKRALHNETAITKACCAGECTDEEIQKITCESCSR